jgi:hypothetical protein
VRCRLEPRRWERLLVLAGCARLLASLRATREQPKNILGANLQVRPLGTDAGALAPLTIAVAADRLLEILLDLGDRPGLSSVRIGPRIA